MTWLSNWVLPTLEFDYTLDESGPKMAYVDPKSSFAHYSGPEDEDTPRTLEEEILRMEKYRREIVKKIGGEKYKKKMAELVKRKQKGR